MKFSRFVVLHTGWLIVAICICRLTPAALAQTGMDQLGSARSAALALASTADLRSTGVHINPAVPAAQRASSVTFFARQPFGLAELRHASVAAAIPIRPIFGHMGAGTYGFDAYRETFLSAGLSGSVPVGTSRPVFVGVDVTYHHLAITSYGSDAAVAGDAGVLVPLLPVLVFGVHARNVAGASIGGDPLPRSLAVGIQYDAGDRARILLDVFKDVSHTWSLRGGLEVSPVSVLALRIGAARHPAIFTTGVGVHVGPIRADVAGERHATLGWSPSGSFTLHW